MSRVAKKVVAMARWECGACAVDGSVMGGARKTQRIFGQQIIFRVDSMARPGARAKERSSTRWWNRLCRLVAAMLIAMRI